MRIAISVVEGKGLDSAVSHHFGRCPYYVLVDIENGEIQEVRSVENPFVQSHQPGMVPGFIRDQGVDVMISGGMGRRALGFFEEYGIDVATGADSTAKESLKRYLAGELRQGEACRESIKHSGCHP